MRQQLPNVLRHKKQSLFPPPQQLPVQHQQPQFRQYLPLVTLKQFRLLLIILYLKL